MSLAAAFARLSCKEIPTTARSFFTGHKLLVQVTPALYAEPLKKKKKIDPAIIKQREERRRKKLEKQIRRLEKNARQLKPIDECEVPLELLDEIKLRSRPKIELSPEEIERRALLHKEWARYKGKKWAENMQTMDRIMESQRKALEELRKESEDLYEAALEFDEKLIPFTAKGPVDTPPIENYECPDGDYIDISKKWT